MRKIYLFCCIIAMLMVIGCQDYLNLSEVKLMYRDADLMDCFPEIGAALDVTVEDTNSLGCYLM